jgi:hypothetical protein
VTVYEFETWPDDPPSREVGMGVGIDRDCARTRIDNGTDPTRYALSLSLLFPSRLYQDG